MAPRVAQHLVHALFLTRVDLYCLARGDRGSGRLQVDLVALVLVELKGAGFVLQELALAHSGFDQVVYLDDHLFHFWVHVCDHLLVAEMSVSRVEFDLVLDLEWILPFDHRHHV